MQEENHREVSLSIILASRQIRNFFSQKLRPFNIGIEQIGTLVILEKHGPLNITDLSNITLKDKGTISRTIESLCKKNFVKKIHEKEDNRITRITITQERKEKLASVNKNKQKIINVFTETISDEEKKEFLRILEKITGVLK
ncbi:hypothetical protein BKH46_03670 [Helicobacter sp. 12S02634-8]|nr:hypothetical protein BKH46_03670 [Helicobacter sp. 12S02634-8]